MAINYDKRIYKSTRRFLLIKMFGCQQAKWGFIRCSCERSKKCLEFLVIIRECISIRERSLCHTVDFVKRYRRVEIFRWKCSHFFLECFFSCHYRGDENIRSAEIWATFMISMLCTWNIGYHLRLLSTVKWYLISEQKILALFVAAA